MWELLLGLAVVGVFAVAFGQTRDRLSLRLVGLLVMLGVLGVGSIALVRYVPTPGIIDPRPQAPPANTTPSPPSTHSPAPSPKPKPKPNTPAASHAPATQPQPFLPKPQQTPRTPPPIGGTPLP